MAGRMGADLPDPAKEASKCRELLAAFKDEMGDRKYMLQLV